MALSKEVIVRAAVALLDEHGERGLTYAALSDVLSTGSGAIYWHVANKGELLAAASLHIVERALADASDTTASAAEGEIRRTAAAAFSAIVDHPWLGARLADPLQPAALLLFDRFGAGLGESGLSPEARFNAASALMNFVLGLAGQYAAGARLAGLDGTREDLLATISNAYQQLDPKQFPYLHAEGQRLLEHDDREQFLAGIELILAGLTRR